MKSVTGIISAAIATACVAISLVSCSKTNAARFEGEYSFTTSGTLTAVPDGEGDAADPVIFRIVNERGQMNIVRKDRSKNDMVISMNILGGDAVAFENAKASGKVLRLTEPYTVRNIRINNNVGNPYADVTIQGSAEKFSDIVIFKLEYQGTVKSGGDTYTIIESKIECIAKEND